MEKRWESRADDKPFVWLSVSPRWADLIASGEKTVEWRKSAPEIAPGTPFLLYASAPDQRVIGAGRVSKVSRGPWRELAAELGARGVASRGELKSYFEGAGRERSARAIELESFASFSTPQPWARFKRLTDGFSPPVAPLRVEGAKALTLSRAVLALSWAQRAPSIALSWVSETGMTEDLQDYFKSKGEQLELSYPGARAWMSKTLREIQERPGEDRDALIAKNKDGAIVAFAIIKKSEKKIASLRVEEGSRAGDGAGGLGVKLFGACCERLGTTEPHWTASEEIWPQLSSLAARMSWPARQGSGGWVIGEPADGLELRVSRPG